MDTTTKAGLDPFKSVSKKVAYEAAEATAEFIGNEMYDKILKPVAEIIIPPKQKRNIEWIKTSITKMVHYEISTF